MVADWRRMSLREAGVQLIDCDHRTPPAADTGHPYIAIPQLKDGRLALADARRISPEHYAEWTRKAKPQHDDAIVSRRCNPGESAYVPAGLECALGQNLVLLRADGRSVFPPFLRWLVSGPAWWEQVGTFLNVGAVFDSLRCADIPNFKLLFPPVFEQEAIASVLGALDDKIELNRRMNATLEAMARALFTSWFVDFDPVRAKLDGQAPLGMDTTTAALFSSAFRDSRLGAIPQGWRIGSILEQASLLSGGTPKTDVATFWNGAVPWASAKDVSQCGEAFLVATERTITELGVEQSSTKVIPELSTVVVARGATTGRLAMIGHAMAMNQTCYGLHSKLEAPFALYCHATHFIDRVVLGGHGSIFDTITTSTFEATEVLLPPADVVLAFNRQVAPLFRQILANLHQSRTLVDLRDALLPRLLSGELCVPKSVAHFEATL
jgi:type I restriction enzyme, S subunit